MGLFALIKANNSKYQASAHSYDQDPYTSVPSDKSRRRSAPPLRNVGSDRWVRAFNDEGGSANPERSPSRSGPSNMLRRGSHYRSASAGQAVRNDSHQSGGSRSRRDNNSDFTTTLHRSRSASHQPISRAVSGRGVAVQPKSILRTRTTSAGPRTLPGPPKALYIPPRDALLQILVVLLDDASMPADILDYVECHPQLGRKTKDDLDVDPSLFEAMSSSISAVDALGRPFHLQLESLPRIVVSCVEEICTRVKDSHHSQVNMASPVQSLLYSTFSRRNSRPPQCSLNHLQTLSTSPRSDPALIATIPTSEIAFLLDAYLSSILPESSLHFELLDALWFCCVDPARDRAGQGGCRSADAPAIDLAKTLLLLFSTSSRALHLAVYLLTFMANAGAGFGDAISKEENDIEHLLSNVFIRWIFGSHSRTIPPLTPDDSCGTAISDHHRLVLQWLLKNWGQICGVLFQDAPDNGSAENETRSEVKIAMVKHTKTQSLPVNQPGVNGEGSHLRRGSCDDQTSSKVGSTASSSSSDQAQHANTNASTRRQNERNGAARRTSQIPRPVTRLPTKAAASELASGRLQPCSTTSDGTASRKHLQSISETFDGAPKTDREGKDAERDTALEERLMDVSFPDEMMSLPTCVERLSEEANGIDSGVPDATALKDSSRRASVNRTDSSSSASSTSASIISDYMYSDAQHSQTPMSSASETDTSEIKLHPLPNSIASLELRLSQARYRILSLERDVKSSEDAAKRAIKESFRDRERVMKLEKRVWELEDELDCARRKLRQGAAGVDVAT